MNGSPRAIYLLKTSKIARAIVLWLKETLFSLMRKKLLKRKMTDGTADGQYLKTSQRLQLNH